MVEGARLESVYTGNCIKGSNPLVSAEISYLKEGEIKEPSKIKAFRFLTFHLLPTFTPLYGYTSVSNSWSTTQIYKDSLKLTQVFYY